MEKSFLADYEMRKTCFSEASVREDVGWLLIQLPYLLQSEPSTQTKVPFKGYQPTRIKQLKYQKNKLSLFFKLLST